MEPGSNLGGESPLRPTKNDVKKLLRRRYGRDILPGCLHLAGVWCGIGQSFTAAKKKLVKGGLIDSTVEKVSAIFRRNLFSETLSCARAGS